MKPRVLNHLRKLVTLHTALDRRRSKSLPVMVKSSIPSEGSIDKRPLLMTWKPSASLMKRLMLITMR